MANEISSQAATPSPEPKGYVLVVEDEPAMLRAQARILEARGYVVEQACDGEAAGVAMKKRRFDAILSDICMPGLNGIQLLRTIRDHDPEVPVVLSTGHPAVDTAAEAVKLGALRYLIKPISDIELVRNIEEAVTIGRIARARREAALKDAAEVQQFADRDAMAASFIEGLAKLWIAYQPIVNISKRSVAAVEALVRTDVPSLPNPSVFLSVAQRIGSLVELGREIRKSVARDMHRLQPQMDVYVNLHANDLHDEELYSLDAPLACFASRVVFEITERESLRDDAAACATRLRALGYRLAIDDLGAGYSGLSYIALLAPEVVKIDISLVRDISSDPVKIKLVSALVRVCKDLGIIVVAEGVETPSERDTLTSLGCDLLQGFLFSKPGRPFPEVTW